MVWTPARPQIVKAFRFDEAVRKNIPIAESSEDALATLDYGIFCLFHWVSRVGAGDTATLWKSGDCRKLIFEWRLQVKRSDAIDLLSQSKLILAERYGVTRLGLFGSAARDSAGIGSDVDGLVAFDGPATSARYFGVQFYLEDMFDCAVDLVTEKALRAELCPFIEKECVRI